MKIIKFNFYKLKIYFLAIIFLQTSLFSTAVISLENKIVLKIDNQIITSFDIKNEINYLTALNPSLTKFDNNEIFEIAKKSIVQEKIKNIEISNKFESTFVPQEYLKRLIKNIYLKIGIDDLENFKSYLKSKNVVYENVISKIKTEALWNELILANFSDKIKIDEAKIEQNIKLKLNKISKSYLLSEIFFELDKNEDLNSKYYKIVKIINNNSFENAALKFSISESSSIGGKLNWISENALNENILKFIDNKKKYEFTKPIQVPGGFLILKINDIKYEKIEKNIKQELEKYIRASRNYQLNQFSNIYFNKIKRNLIINEI